MGGNIPLLAIRGYQMLHSSRILTPSLFLYVFSSVTVEAANLDQNYAICIHGCNICLHMILVLSANKNPHANTVLSLKK